MKEFLSQNNVKHAYVDITDSMLFLKNFLKYRDHRSEFEEIKAKGKVGIPCIVVNDGEEIYFEQSDLNKLLDK